MSQATVTQVLKCNHLVYHPKPGSSEYKALMAVFRNALVMGDTLVPIMAEQLFGECEART